MRVKVEAMASLLHNMTVSTALADLSVGIDAALDVAWTPTTLKVRQFIAGLGHVVSVSAVVRDGAELFKR